ncbi:flagellar hook-associated protein FlgK [Pseudoalteromonas fenneropenaei]|uniref:Flagellar hook-associated protein 1 n=1 Tax=Pseudoalteromonas fenneropenaei TaxID=1737459 RepID=A0ABV7CGW3_9GAMM
MSYDLLNIGASGIRANSQLLQTTSKNISNLNTQGYVRERTEYSTMIGDQLGRGETVRLINEFAVKQLNRDLANKTYYDQFVSEASRVDNLFAEDSSSLSTSINKLFNHLQEAMNQPASSVNRGLFFTGAQNLVDQMDRLSGIVLDQKNTVNEQLAIFSEEANSLIKNISDLNNKITTFQSPQAQQANSAVYNERDLAIKKLAELVDIETLDGSNGQKLVFLGTGQSLVMEEGAFNLFSTNGDPDPNFKELTLDVSGAQAVALELNPANLKGKIGGLLAFRDEILIPAQNQLGQMAISIADAFNQQNHLGLDLDGNLGGDLFNIPTVGAYAYKANTGSATISATLEAGEGKKIPANDFLIEYVNATQVSVTALDNRGNPVGNAQTFNIGAPPSTINSANLAAPSTDAFGLELNISAGGAVGDKFLVKLNSEAAGNLSLATTRAEHLALASPVRASSAAGNTSSASLTTGTVTNTGTGSNFSGTPPTFTDGPITITKTANANEYTISDASGSVTFTTSGNSKNILAQAGAPFNTYGFDFDLEGQAATGDSFTIEFNTGGYDDNRNGLALANLQNAELVRHNVVSSANTDNLKTFNESFAKLVTDVGVVTSQAKTNGAAFAALAEQSEAWYESLSGVNLDEEAANLLRFQQSYSASAQIISAARAVFDTLLSAAR